MGLELLISPNMLAKQIAIQEDEGVQGELDSKNKALFFFTPGAYSIVLIFANFRPGAYSVVLIYISAEPVPGVLISGI